jgi:hypothetical protein
MQIISTLYSLDTWFFFGYAIVSTLRKGDNRIIVVKTIIIILLTQTNRNRNLIYQVLKTEFLLWRKYAIFLLQI